MIIMIIKIFSTIRRKKKIHFIAFPCKSSWSVQDLLLRSENDTVSKFAN